MSITLTALQKQRQDTAANWTSANSILLAGELGFESDTGKAKLGDGTTAWNSLSYLGLIPSNGLYPLNQFVAPLGTVSAPSLTFVGDLNTGIYSPGADQLSVTAGGTQQIAVSTSNTTFNQHVNLASTKEYRINGTKVLDATSLGSAVVSSSLTSVGTIGTGTWQGSIVGPTYGGTGVNNGSSTITLGGNFTTSGAFATTLTVTGTTNVTLPTSGTLISTAVTSLPSLATVGTITSGTWQGSTIGVAYGGTGQTSYTNGQLLIGNTTGNTLTKATLTAGTGITITNGAGNITISSGSSAGSNLYLTTICI